MVKSASKVSVLVLTAALSAGCATQSDLDALRADLSTTDRKADDAKAAADQALAAAERAEQKASDAESAALRAARAAEEANSKLDRMFKHSMMK